jgi:CheY-like chemotaxis protein
MRPCRERSSSRTTKGCEPITPPFSFSTGLDVLSASSGEEALALLGPGHVDLAVLDIGLPGMSGFDVADALGDTPVIIVTGDPVGAYAQAYGRRGLDYRVLPKPVPPEVLEHALDEVLAVV